MLACCLASFASVRSSCLTSSSCVEIDRPIALNVLFAAHLPIRHWLFVVSHLPLACWVVSLSLACVLACLLVFCRLASLRTSCRTLAAFLSWCASLPHLRSSKLIVPSSDRHIRAPLHLFFLPSFLPCFRSFALPAGIPACMPEQNRLRHDLSPWFR